VYKLKDHNVFYIGAQLIVLGCALGIFFGQGTHLHNIAFHVGDHIDIHTSVHSHAPDSDHDTEAPHSSDKNNEHDHEVQNFDIRGILVSPVKVVTDSKAQTIEIPFSKTKAHFQQFSECLFLLDLPPPDKLFQQRNALSFSLRGPPVA
jgi:hypothetical protein